jgi:transposase
VELSGTRHHHYARHRGPSGPRKCPQSVKKNARRYGRPTGRLAPNPAELAYGHLALAALEYRAQRGEIILLYEEETVLWRFALPRAGWWPQPTRYRLPLRPLTRSQSNHAEACKRQAWRQYPSWDRLKDGVLLTLMGAVQSGTSKVFSKLVPHFDAREFRQYLHQLMATFGKTGKEVVLVVDRSGIHRAHHLTPTLERWAGRLRFHFLPAHSGHHLNPIEGFWRVLKSTVGAGRSLSTLRSLYQRTRQVLMAHQRKPISTFHW